MKYFKIMSLKKKALIRLENEDLIRSVLQYLSNDLRTLLNVSVSSKICYKSCQNLSIYLSSAEAKKYKRTISSNSFNWSIQKPYHLLLTSFGYYFKNDYPFPEYYLAKTALFVDSGKYKSRAHCYKTLDMVKSKFLLLIKCATSVDYLQNMYVSEITIENNYNLLTLDVLQLKEMKVLDKMIIDFSTPILRRLYYYELIEGVDEYGNKLEKIDLDFKQYYIPKIQSLLIRSYKVCFYSLDLLNRMQTKLAKNCLQKITFIKLTFNAEREFEELRVLLCKNKFLALKAVKFEKCVFNVKCVQYLTKLIKELQFLKILTFNKCDLDNISNLEIYFEVNNFELNLQGWSTFTAERNEELRNMI